MKECEDAISREEAKKTMFDLCGDGSLKENPWRDNPNIDAIIDALDNMPPVYPKAKVGKWIKEKSIYGWDGYSYQCSECGRSIHIDTKIEDLSDYPYCHCGAKMQEVEE